MSVEAKLGFNIDNATLNSFITKIKQVGTEAGLSEKEIDKITASTKNLDTKGTKNLDNINTKLGGMNKLVDSVGKAFLGWVAVEKLAAVYGALEKNAAFLELLDQKAKTVFGNYAKQVEQVGLTTARSIGLSEKQFLAAATAAGDLLVPMQFTRQESGRMSVEMLKLSGALARWTGGQKSTTEVSEILTKALLGEREQLKTLGISIQEADVQTRLAEKGQAKLTGTALQQAKALATVELITEKSTDAQAAFAAGGDALVDVEDRISAASSNTADILSDLLTPAFHAAKEGTATWLESLEGASRALRGIVQDDSKNWFQKLVAIFDPSGLSQMQAIAVDSAKQVAESVDEGLEEGIKGIEPKGDQVASKLLGLGEFDYKATAKEVFAQIEDAANEWLQAEKDIADIQRQILEDGERDLKDYYASAEELEENYFDRMKESRLELFAFLSEIADSSLLLAQTVGESIFQINQQNRDADLESLEAKQEKELELAGNNESAKDQIKKDYLEKEKEYQKESADAKRRLFLFQRAVDLASVIIKTRLAVAEAIAISTITLGEPMATYARIQGAISAATILAQALPAFKDGVFDLSGPGTETSDSITARLSKGESVVPASKSRRFDYVLKPLINDPRFSEKDLAALTLRHIDLDSTSVSKGISEQRLEEISKQLDKVVRAINDKEHIELNIDNRGIALHVIKERNRTEYLNRKFKTRL
jgi:hypothetical protein